MTADYNASCEGSCGSLLSIEACSKQSTPESHAVIKGSKHGLMFEKFGSFVVATYRLFTSALDTTTEFLNCDIVTLIIILAFIYFVYKKIIVPFNYVQDLDLPSVTQTKKNMINLTRMLRRIGKKLPPPYPNGWYGVMESSELKEGAVKQVDCFGEALAVFRGEGGAVHALDAHCPHLGANMAAGGAVRGDCLECPFHRWRFSGHSGACVSIPGVDTVPKSAAVRTWECREIDGAVFVWFHCDGEPPSYEIPSVAKVASGDWTYMARNDFLIPCHIQDIPENGADLAHLNALHGDHLVAGKLLPTSDIYNILGKHVWSGIWKPSENPHIASVELKHDIRLFDKFSILDVEVTATQVGPSYVLMDIRHKLCHVVILQTVTPIAPLVQRVTHRLYAPPLFKPLANLLMWAETVMFHRDVMVWASKQFVQQPLLVKTDKCLKSYRNWFKQFYSETSTTFEDALKNISSPIDW